MPSFPLSGLHSNAMHTILTGNFLRQLSESEMLLIEALPPGCAAGTGVALRLPAPSPWAHSGSPSATWSVPCSASSMATASPTWCVPCSCSPWPPVAIVVQRYVTEEKARLEGLRQRDFIRDTFGRYLRPDVVEELLGSPQGLAMGGGLREIALLSVRPAWLYLPRPPGCRRLRSLPCSIATSNA